MKNAGYFGKINAKRAAFWHGHPSKSLHVILVVGEYGKSTTALLIANLLEADERKVALFTNLESRIDTEPYKTPYDTSADALHSALGAARKKNVEFVILEVTPFIRQHHIFSTIQYNSIVATSVTDDLGLFFNQEVESAALPFAKEPTQISVAPHQIIYFGDEKGSDALIKDVRLHRGGTELTMVLDHHHEYEIATYLCGTANVLNVAAAIALVYVLGGNVDTFAEGIARVESVPGNFETLATKTPYRVIMDRASTAHSLKLVIESAKQLTKRRLIVALDPRFDTTTVSLTEGIADQVVVYGSAHDDGHLKIAKNQPDAVRSALRGGRIDDTVLFIGPAYQGVSIHDIPDTAENSTGE